MVQRKSIKLVLTFIFQIQSMQIYNKFTGIKKLLTLSANSDTYRLASENILLSLTWGRF